MVDQQGRVYARINDHISGSRALELARTGAVVVWDSCGCGGGCGMDWFDEQEVAAMASSGTPDIRHTKRAHGTISEWRADDGAWLLLAEGAVRWSGKLG